MLLVIIVMSLLTLAIIFYIIYTHLNADKQLIHSRISRYVDRTAPAIATGPGDVKQVAGWRILIRRFSTYVESPQWSRVIEHKLIQAGIPMRGSEFLVVCLGAGGFCALVLLIMTGGKWLIGIAGAVVGYVAPLIVLKLKIEQRAKAFNLQLGDSLILIANSLRTGYSFMQSIEMVSREMPRPIGEEFGRVLKEMNLGITTEEALNNLAKRVNSDDLDLAITAVLIQRQVGGNLAEVLDNISLTIRERVKIKGQVKTLTAQGRISGIIISLLPIAVGFVISIINPGYVQILFTSSMGKAMVAAGIISQVIGIFLIRKIVNIQV